jgi:U3 small nucleolar RNA-associated protein 4
VGNNLYNSHRLLSCRQKGAFGSFCVTNMVQGMPKRCKTVPIAHVRGRKRKKYVEETKVDPNHGNCTLCMRYNSIIHTDFVSDKEMVVVEQPWLNVVAGFPPALERKVYGT